MTTQTDLFGNEVMPEIHPHTIVRRLMREKPVTWQSHRQLMIEVARELGIPWDTMPKIHRYILEELLNLSPDFERAARKVREEDEAMKI